MEAMRREAAAHIRDGFAFLEMTLLAGGREWKLKTDRPSLANIEGTAHLHLHSSTCSLGGGGQAMGIRLAQWT